MAKAVIHPLIQSQLDYYKYVFDSLPDCDIAKTQSILNAAACLISQTRKFGHIAAILTELNRLHACQYVLFKILVIVYKSLHGLPIL